MKLVTEAGVLWCDHHTGRVENKPGQDLVRIAGNRVLVETDPEGRAIKGCDNLNPATGMKPCQNTLKVESGYSTWVRVDGHRVCLDSVTGYTDGTPPGLVHYTVHEPGQQLVASSS